MASAPSLTGLLGLPAEMFLMILSHLEIRELGPLMQTSRAVNSMTAPAFYHRIYTKEKTHYDTAGWVELLKRQPDVKDLIHVMVIDELDEAAYRELLAFDMPRLESILLQHESAILKPATAEKRKELNKLFRPKPNINNFTFNVMHDPYEWQPELRKLYRTPIDDAIFFNHPTLTRIRICYLDLTALGDPSIDPFPLDALKTLQIEICKMDICSISNLLLRTKSLEYFRFHHEVFPPCTPEEFQSLLFPSRNTLKVLKLIWRRFPERETAGMDMSEFKALKQFMVDPRVLFPRLSLDTDFRYLLRERMPPNLKMFTLDNLATHQLAFAQGAGNRMKISRVHGRLMRTILEEKAVLFPHLAFLLMYNLYAMHEPTWLYPLADAQGVKLAPLHHGDEPWPSIEWLDSAVVSGGGFLLQRVAWDGETSDSEYGDGGEGDVVVEEEEEEEEE